MAKLYFRYGTVGSAKTLNLLAVAHNYRQQGKGVLILKPAMDTRFGRDMVKTRAGLEMKADVLVDDQTDLFLQDLTNISCILVDEAQFIPQSVLQDLHEIVITREVPVLCYGLRTDFKQQLFPGAKCLLELADTIEEIKTTCAFCNAKAIFNLKIINNKAIFEGPQVELGAEEKYQGVCKTCYFERKNQNNTSDLTDQ